MIGVVIPAYNEGRHISACLSSILLATKHPRLGGRLVSVPVVLDDCSDDTGMLVSAKDIAALNVSSAGPRALRKLPHAACIDLAGKSFGRVGRRVLRSARNTHYAVLGAAMGDVVVHSTQHLNDGDLQAVAAYLKALPVTDHQPSSFKDDPATALALAAGKEGSRGAELYIDNCAACHRTNGKGDAHMFPTISGNSSVLAQDPVSLIRLLLVGSNLPATSTAPYELGMPGFAWRLSDDEITQLLTFIRSSWGNQAPGVRAEQVKALRDTLNKDSPGVSRIDIAKS